MFHGLQKMHLDHYIHNKHETIQFNKVSKVAHDPLFLTSKYFTLYINEHFVEYCIIDFEELKL